MSECTFENSGQRWQVGPAGKGHFSPHKEEGSSIQFGAAQTKPTEKNSVSLCGWQMNKKDC